MTPEQIVAVVILGLVGLASLHVLVMALISSFEDDRQTREIAYYELRLSILSIRSRRW